MNKQPLSLVLRSFGLKYTPVLEANLTLDVRFLPNPFWIDELKPFSGLDAPIQQYFSQQTDVQTFIQGLSDYLLFWLTHFQKDLGEEAIIAIGCTGGQHRSVYVIESLSKKLSAALDPSLVEIRTEHREQARWIK
jgi:UPF0042 nucleotide-binding protein